MVSKVSSNTQAGNTRYATYTIVALNVLVFIAMVISGVNFLNPSAADLLLWGANNHVYTASGDWWRLITGIFLHAGIVHLFFNMYALLVAGIYLEPILGRWKFLAAFFSCGVLGSAASILWNDNVLSVGACGGNFGLYGIFLVLFITNYIERNITKSLLLSMVIFIGFTVARGFIDGTDDVVPLAGLVSGLVIGCIFYFIRGKQLFVPIALLLTIAVSIPVLNTRRDDTVRFGKLWDQFADLEEKGLAPLRNSDKLDSASFIREVETISLPTFNEMKDLLSEAKRYHLPKDLVTERVLMNKYIDQRIQHTQLWLQLVKDQNGNLWPQWDSLAREIDTTLEQLKK